MPSKHDTRYRQIGGRHRAASRYAMIAHRLANVDRPKNRGYAGIELRVSREDFITWFRANDFEGCSVDRIDRCGHYELSNMQLVPLATNIAKEKLIAADGTTVCSRCDKIKPLDEFTKDRRRMHTGRTTCCRTCDVARKQR